MLQDFLSVCYWWLLLFGLGITFLPLTSYLFKKFFDRGYALSKIIGVLITSYLVWLLGSLKIVPFFSESLWLIVLVLIGFQFWLVKKLKVNLKKLISQNWRIFLLEELLFLLALAFWSFVRGFQPSIEGLEKYMDYGFVNSILRSRYFPPADMWLAGQTINYYYFGHLTAAVLTKLSGLDSAITYNLLIATLFALTLTASFCLGGNLVFIGFEKRLLKKPNLKFVFLGGILAAALLTLGANLQPLWWFFTHHNFKEYWYPDATRFIVPKFGAVDNTIHEFPIYSFVVADLHGHLLNLPSVLLFLAFSLNIFTRKKIPLYLYICISLLLALFYMTNSWDLAVYTLVFGTLVLFYFYSKFKLDIKTILQTAKTILICLVTAFVFSLPFHLHFQNIAQGIAKVEYHTPAWMFLVLWGLPLVNTLAFVIFILKPKISFRSDFLKTVAQHFSPKKLSVNSIILVLLLVSWLLIIIPEFIYVKDIYIRTHQRANTMFKLTYQSFVMSSLAGSYIFIGLLKNLKRNFLKTLALFLILILFIPVLIYPYFAVRSYYGMKEYQGLYGLSYLSPLYPNDFQAILWLKKNIVGQPVIVEAVGESYTQFARVSANTGLPTILGWRVHEWLWRGSFDEAGRRTEEVQNIYQSQNLSQVRQLLQKYNVKYVFIGKLEFQQYSGMNEKKFASLGREVFRSGTTVIYEINY